MVERNVRVKLTVQTRSNDSQNDGQNRFFHTVFQDLQSDDMPNDI